MQRNNGDFGETGEKRNMAFLSYADSSTTKSDMLDLLAIHGRIDATEACGLAAPALA
jgi:hypothetical protein